MHIYYIRTYLYTYIHTYIHSAFRWKHLHTSKRESIHTNHHEADLSFAERTHMYAKSFWNESSAPSERVGMFPFLRYIYIYICVCVCVCLYMYVCMQNHFGMNQIHLVSVWEYFNFSGIHIYIYIYMHVHVRMYACMHVSKAYICIYVCKVILE